MTPEEVRALAEPIAARFGVSASLPVLQALVDHESGRRPYAVGDGGKSLGLTQLHAAGLGRGMTDAERFDPVANLTRAIDYHKRYLDAYGGDIAAAVTAHNAGGGAVNAAYQAGGDWRNVVHHRADDGRIVTVAEIYTLPVLHTARSRYGWAG